MKFHKSPETFKVEEVLQPALREGKYFYYGNIYLFRY